MKRRNREVNIFSVSLLDILCGALGAFCFMTIVLMPYYKPNVVDAKEMQQMQQDMQKEIERLKALLSQTPNGRELVRQLEQLQRRVQEMQGQMNQQARQLEEERKQNRQLQNRNPVVVSISWAAPNADVDLYARPVMNADPSKGAEPVDAAKRQSSRFRGDTQIFCSKGPCMEVALLRDNPPDWRVEIYYKFLSASGSTEPVLTRGYFQNEGKSQPLPAVGLTRPGTAVLVGKIQVKADRSIQFEPEREFAADYRKLLEQWNKPAN